MATSLSTVERAILQISKPTIELDEFNIVDIAETPNSTFSSQDGKLEGMPKLSELSNKYPYLKIKDTIVPIDKLRYVSINVMGLVPTLSVVMNSVDEIAETENFPNPGDIIQLYSDSATKESFKSLRMDFIIKKCEVSGTRAEIMSIEGVLNVPWLYGSKQVSIKDTSFNTLKKISELAGLGFATNVSSTGDYQVWNSFNRTMDEYINNISRHAYSNDDSFFSTFVDQYYNLNLVDVNISLAPGDEIEVTKLIMMGPSQYTSSQDTPEVKKYDGGVDYFNFITNSLQFNNAVNYILSYKKIQDGGSIISDGYENVINFWDLNNERIVTEDITYSWENNIPEGQLALNSPRILPDTSKSMSYDNAYNEFRNNLYVGMLDTDNVHPNFKKASMHQKLELRDLERNGMEVTLKGYSPSIIRGQRIYVQIYTSNQTEKSMMDNKNRDGGLYEESGNDKASEQIKEQDTQSSVQSSQVVNELLTGFYYVSGIKYIYDASNTFDRNISSNNLKTVLTLHRRYQTQLTQTF